MEQRGIECLFEEVNTASDFENIAKGDLFFFGGGQDADQMVVWREIQKDQDRFMAEVLQAVDSKKVFLLVCGGYQLFGHSFIDAAGHAIPGLGILDIETRSAGPQVKTRCIGNIVVESALPLDPKTLVGFENHGGQTHLANALQPLGKVVKGYGNNIQDGKEGCIYKNVIGTYMHGSLLPKNPHLADYLIEQALCVKYGTPTEPLTPLDDYIEWEAHREVLRSLHLGRP